MNDRSTSCATDSMDSVATAAGREGSGAAGGRSVRVIGALVVVAVLAAVVWWLWPARHAAQVLHGGTPEHTVAVTLGDRPGIADIGIELADRSGNPVPHAMIEVQAVEPRMGYAGEPVVAADRGAGSYHAMNVGFMTTGPWQLRLSITTANGAEDLSLPLWIGG